MKQQLCALATAVLLAVTLGGTHAIASDAKAYPGASCQPAYPQDHSIAYYWGGRVRNLSANWLSVSCPIITNNDIYGAIIAMEDYHPTGYVSCSLRSWWWTGGWPADTFSLLGSRTFSTAGTVGGLVVQPDANVSLPRGEYYELYCSVPPISGGRLSGILYYKVYETMGSIPD